MVEHFKAIKEMAKNRSWTH